MTYRLFLATLVLSLTSAIGAATKLGSKQNLVGRENSGSNLTSPELKFQRQQQPAPEIEKQIMDFQGQRSPPLSTLDLKLAPLKDKSDGKSWEVLEVPGDSPFKDRIKKGDHINLEDLAK